MRAHTAGDGAPPLRSAILHHIAADWEEFADIRAAARALSQRSRLRNALSIAVNSVRVALAAAALCADRSASPATVLSREDEQHRLDTIQRALRLHAHARAVLLDCEGPLASDWFLSPPQVQAVMEAFGSVVGGGGDTSPAAPSPAPTSPPRPVVQPFQQGVHLFLAAVAQGMPASEALRLFAQLGNGQFSHDDRCFFPTNEVLGPVVDRIGLLHRAERKVIRRGEGEADTTLFLVMWRAR